MAETTELREAGREGGRFAFGPFCLSPGERLLTRDGRPVALGGRSFDLLVALVEQAGKVLSKRELLERVWPDVVVEDGSLRFHMVALRRSLGDGIDGSRYIATQVGVGYAFVFPVQPVAAAGSQAMPAPAPIRPQAAVLAAPPLPTRMAHVLGRDGDIDFLVGRLGEKQLFTIVGAAGVGKTTLAVEIGYRMLDVFSGKVCFIDLGALEEASLVASAVANALRIPVLGEDPATVLLGHIRRERLLLIFDNCEHLIGEVATIAERIAQAAPEVRILATSREPLRVIGEQVHWLGSLDYPEETAGMRLGLLMSYPAIQLFIERAVAADSALQIDLEAARQIAEVCRRLDGMALPIELAAVRVATHGLETTARLIGEAFSLGWTGRRTAVARQRTLQAALDWSYDLLTAEERLCFERLSVFIGPFTLEAALAVSAGGDIAPPAAAVALDGLIAKSLIAVDRAAGPHPYRLLEMNRAYAREKLRQRGVEDHALAARRHAAFYLALLEEGLSLDKSLSEGAARIAGQIGNIRSALSESFGPAGDTTVGIRLAAASAPVFMNMSLLLECRSWSARALAALDGDRAGTAVEFELQAALGLSLMFTRGNSEAVDIALRRALEIASALEDPWAQIRVLARLHILHERIGDYAEAHRWALMALAVAEAMNDDEALAIASSLCGISYHLGGDQPRARFYLEQTLRLAQPSERWRTVHYGFDHRNRAIIALARTSWLMGFAGRAERLAVQAVEEAAVLGHPVTLCIALVWALPIYIAIGDFTQAAVTLDRFAEIAEVNGFAPYIAAVRGLRGNQLVRQGRPAEALGELQESLSRLRAARYELLTASFTISLSLGLCAVGRIEEALEQITSLTVRSLESGELIYLPELLRLKAGILLNFGAHNQKQAEALLREAITASRQQGTPAWEIRAVADLAALLTSQGRSGESAGVVAEMYSRPGQDGETPDILSPQRMKQVLAFQDLTNGWRAVRS
ncbi:ATP-binding protein [Radicibacter daui]|uniref:ATP-binding protein n=1 Tax=Radicibacter daui TaxID=3064829 RepID=UPI004047010A